MRFTLVSLTLLIAFAGATVVPVAARAPNDQLAGDWVGHIALRGTELGIQLHFDPTPASVEPSGTIDIPAQGLRGFALSAIEQNEGEVTFAMAGIPGEPRFGGTIAGDRMEGTFSQGGQAFPFVLERGEATAQKGATPSRGMPGDGLAGVWQGSLRPGPVELRLVLHAVESAGGELTISLDSLDQGARGIEATHQSIEAGHVALRFASIGGRFEGTINEDGSQLDGTWTQGQSAFPLTFFRLPEAPEVARPQNPEKPYPYDEYEVTVPNPGAGIELLLRQQEDLLRVSGVGQLLSAEQAAANARIFRLVREEGDTADNRAAVAAILEGVVEGLSPAAQRAYGVSASTIDRQLELLFSPWLRALLAYDPAPTLTRVRCPVLALYGTLDLQVAGEENLEAIRTALEAGGHAAVEAHLLPGLNHIFQRAGTGAPSEYGLIEETMAPEVLALVADWIGRMTRR